MTWFWVVGISTLLVGCGTYRTGSGEYHGAGEFKTPSDFPLPAAPSTTDATSDEYFESKDSPGIGRLENKSRYIPRAQFKLSWPLAQVRINRGFDLERRKPHTGVDMGGRRGSPILAAHEGVVVYAGRDFRGYGNMALIEYSKEWATLYGHLDKIARREGSIVRAGDPIGSMGRTGHATGVHLHFELLHFKQPVDPLPFLNPNSN